jgi:hypothetical protein
MSFTIKVDDFLVIAKKGSWLVISHKTYIFVYNSWRGGPSTLL